MTIEQCKRSDLNQIKEISDHQFGVNYLSEADLLTYFSSENSQFIVSLDHEVVTGFSIFIQGYFEDILAEIGSEYNEELKSLKQHTLIHLHKTTAVKESYRNRGIGSELLHYAFRKNAADVYLSLVWNRKIHNSMQHMITKHGFTPFCEIDNYWSNSSLLKEYDCPECGKPPCTCSLIIMTKEPRSNVN